MKKLTKSILAICLTVLLFGEVFLCTAQNLITEKEKIEAKIKELDILEATSFANEDYATLDKILDSDYTVTNTRNSIVQSWGQIKTLMKAGKIKHPSIERIVEGVFVRGDVVVSMGSEVVKTVEGKIERRRYTDVWMKKNEEWKLYFRQASLICDN